MTLLGALAGTAAAAPYVLPSPQSGALTPYDWQPVYAIEGIYSIAQDGDMPDTYGLRGSLNLYSDAEGTFRHQFNINVAPSWGSDDITLAGVKYDNDLFIMPVTLGYNLNIELLDDTFLYLGGKAGYAWSQWESSSALGSWDESAGGFTFSVGGGIKFQCSDSTYIHAGYEFGRSYFDTTADTIYGAHTISVGVGCKF